MSLNLVALEIVSSQLKDLGTEPACFKDIVQLLNVAFQSDEVNGPVQSEHLNTLLGCLNTIVTDYIRIKPLKNLASNNEKMLITIREKETALNDELYTFCETFNTLCRTTGVSEYFKDANKELLWDELLNYFGTNGELV